MKVQRRSDAGDNAYDDADDDDDGAPGLLFFPSSPVFPPPLCVKTTASPTSSNEHVRLGALIDNLNSLISSNARR